MKRMILALMVLAATPILILAQKEDDVEKEKAAIQSLIERHYLEVLYGEKGLEALPGGFHSEFQMLVLQNNAIDRRSLDRWMGKLRTNRAKRGPGPRPRYSWSFKLVDVTGFAAVAKIEIRKGETVSATDYLTLYKFEEGWKIVTKTFDW